MNIKFWLTVIAMALVLETILPATAPKVWRNLLKHISKLADNQIQILALIVLGFAVVSIIMLDYIN